MDNFTHIAVLAALAVVFVHQILKLNIIPVAFANRYPVPTNIILSIVASVMAVLPTGKLTTTVWTVWVQLIATVAVVAAITYNQLLAQWKQLKSIEGEGKSAPVSPTVPASGADQPVVSQVSVSNAPTPPVADTTAV